MTTLIRIPVYIIMLSVGSFALRKAVYKPVHLMRILVFIMVVLPSSLRFLASLQIFF